MAGFAKYTEAYNVDSYGSDGVVYDDLRVSPNSLPGVGANSPTHVIVSNDGSAVTTYGLEFNGSSSKGVVSDYSSLDRTDLSISLWINPDKTDQIELVDRENQLEFYINGGQVYVKVGSRNTNSGNIILTGATQHLVITAETNGTKTDIQIYVNGVLQFSDSVNDTFGADTTGLTIGEWYNGGWNYDGKMDALYGYNVILTQSQVSELYNDGEGTTSHPTGITEATDVVFKFDFEENTGTTTDNDCTLGAGQDMTLTDITWTSGLIGVTTGSIGVTALEFKAGQTSEVFFTAQLPHAYKLEGDIYPHVHRMHKTANTGNVVWGLEYLWVSINGASGNTTIVEKAIDVGASGHHNMDNIATLSGTGKGISSILTCRLYRKGNDSADTFPDSVYLSEFDFHYPIDTVGSKEVGSKR